MSKKKLFIGMMVVIMMLAGFSFALENDGMTNTVANILKFDTLTASTDVLKNAPREKVKRKVKVQRDQAMQFIDHEDIKDFEPEYGVSSSSIVVEQARRDLEGLEMGFENLR